LDVDVADGLEAAALELVEPLLPQPAIRPTTTSAAADTPTRETIMNAPPGDCRRCHD
jgi:hypothetical protein